MDAVEVWNMEGVKWMLESNEKIDADTKLAVENASSVAEHVMFFRSLLSLMKDSSWKNENIYQATASARKDLEAAGSVSVINGSCIGDQPFLSNPNMHLLPADCPTKLSQEKAQQHDYSPFFDILCDVLCACRVHEKSPPKWWPTCPWHHCCTLPAQKRMM